MTERSPLMMSDCRTFSGLVIAMENWYIDLVIFALVETVGGWIGYCGGDFAGSTSSSDCSSSLSSCSSSSSPSSPSSRTSFAGYPCVAEVGTAEAMWLSTGVLIGGDDWC